MTMRMFGLLFISISIFLGFPGCQYLTEKPPPPATSAVPLPNAYPMTGQQKMQAVHHWRVLAQNTADIIRANVIKNFPEYQEAIYVVPAGITPFDKAFNDLLITSLVEKGLVVTHNYQNPLVLSFDTQIIAHNRASDAGKDGLPEKEVMVTLSLMYKGSYMMRNSSIYYIDDPEWWHYAQKAQVQDPAVAVYTLVNK
ncbi:MAG: hypothetical protein K9N10_07145 [Deltaproteobacteria bacterium]|nr:hypothetical protein [Deltaproteobacteria bacterium]